jgi:predicted PhzF superfamily epimerase YddE/YHI9
VVQQCGVGLVRIRRDGARLAFAAPPLRRSGPLDDDLQACIAAGLGLHADEIVRHQWVDNGPGWCAVMLGSAARVLAVQPDWALLGDLKLGLVGPQPAGADTAIEVRALFGSGGQGFEDPVTGSLNASIAQWLIGEGVLPRAYVAAQGQALQRAGRVHVACVDGEVWVGGDVTPVIDGVVSL